MERVFEMASSTKLLHEFCTMSITDKSIKNFNYKLDKLSSLTIENGQVVIVRRERKWGLREKQTRFNIVTEAVEIINILMDYGIYIKFDIYH